MVGMFTYESTAQEHLIGSRRSLNTRSDDDDNCSGEHAGTSSKVIVCRPGEEDGSDRTNVIHGKNETSAGSCHGPTNKVVNT